MIQTHPIQSDTKLESKPIPSHKSGKRWIYNGLADFFLLHGAVGLITVPLVVFAFISTDSWVPLLVTYGLLLGMPHLAATHLRLNLDSDCKERFRWLALVAPIVIISAVFATVFSFGAALPYLVFGWFAAQTFHANAQNFGIMRRYVRMSGASRDAMVDKAAEMLIQIVPWTFVSTCLLRPTTSYLGYDIVLPSSSIVLPICIGLWAITLPILIAYIVLEARALIVGQSVPGRILCVTTGLLVNSLAWLVVREVHWGYLIISTWHSIQYIAYVHAFRKNPPPGSTPVKLSAMQHLGIIFLIGALATAVLYQVQAFIPLLALSIHLGMNFHHYLSDMLIWRKPPSKSPVLT